MGAHRTHVVINTVAAPPGVAFNMIERHGMHHRPRRPSSRTGKRGYYLRNTRRIRTKSAGSLGVYARLSRLVSCDHPRTSNRIFAQFHAQAKHLERSKSTTCGAFPRFPCLRLL